jgi:hypothetical protein
VTKHGKKFAIGNLQINAINGFDLAKTLFDSSQSDSNRHVGILIDSPRKSTFAVN